MAEIDTGDILRIGATFEFEGAYEVTNVWHVLVTAGGGVSYAVGALDVQDYMDDIYQEFKVTFSDEMVSDFLTLSNVTQDTTFGAIAWGVAITGSDVGAQNAPGVCLFTWIRTLKPRVQIRKYLGVHTENSLANGEFNAAARADANDGMAIHALNWALGANLQFQGVAYNRTLLTHTTGISVSTSAEPAYQRRRKRGRGS